MLKQLKRARDRFFGAGEADTSVPVLDGPLKPNHILENAEVFFEATGLEDICITADGRLMVAGSAQLDAQQISSRLSTLRPMGRYRLRLDGGSPAVLRLSTLEGSLQLNGTGQWVGRACSGAHRLQ